MPTRRLTLLIEDKDDKILSSIQDNENIIQYWMSPKLKGQPREVNILAASDEMQDLVDKLQQKCAQEESWRMIISPVETTIPRPEEKEEEETPKAKKTYGTMTREALYDQIMKGAETNIDFMILVALSTVVAAIGLITSNIAVIIGAMVIAPLLGPNLALSLGVTLGDRNLILKALHANAVGVGLTLIISIIFALFVPYDHFSDSEEYLSRTTAGYGGIALAMASGAAAALSLTAGISSAMVGVMVAVALMPPAVVLGLSLGAGAFEHAYGAMLLLAINVISINISTKIVFMLKGIKPRTWYQRKKSEQSLKISAILWGVLLLILMILIYLWQYR